MTDNTPKPTRDAKDLLRAYMHRAYIRRNSHVPRRYYRLRITPDMVGMSLASVISLLNRRERYRCRNPRLLERK